jgi:hypothetical protein
MLSRTPGTPRQDIPNDVGTLWTMQRRRHSARCALMAWPASWELRVVVGSEILLTEHCAHADEAFTLAELWKRSMHERGWRQVVPHSARRAHVDDPQTT